MPRLLIVDDKPDNLYYLDALFTAHGYTVERAQHGAEALVRARAAVPDVVISDLLMPVMDGYTLLRHWKSDARLSAVPFIVYTATYTEPDDERLAYALGADAFILKPSEPDELLARVRDVEAAVKAGRPLREPRALVDEPDLLKVYSQTLVRKLEEKSLQLEHANETLQREVAERRQITELQNALLSSLAEGVHGVALDGTITFENEAANALLGWSRGALIGRNVHEAIHHHRPDGTSYPFEDCPVYRTLQDGRVRRVTDEVYFRRDGTPFPVEFTCAPLRDADGRIAGAVVSFRDVSERLMADESLRVSEERFRQLAETISQVFWMSDVSEGRMLYVSPAYEAIWGRSCQELYSRPDTWLTAIHPEDRESVRTALALQAVGKYDISYRILRPDGTMRWVHDRAFPVRNASGEVYRIVGTAEDITERKAIEGQFLRAQRMESIGTMAGGIAHDLNNVLTPILMSIDMLKEEDTPEGRAETIATIEASATKGADMVRQVLSFARGVEGQRVDVDLRRVMRDVAKIGNDTFLKTIQLRVATPNELPSVLGDPTQLHQVLLNLCVNARDAMPNGGTITLSARPRTLTQPEAAVFAAAPGPYVMLEVADTGTGISPEVRDRIFEPFFTTKEPGKGTGLGLSTSLAIVKSHGGFFHVRSAPGAGTTFEIYLPVSSGEGREVESAARRKTLRGNNELVLVIDDEATIREMTRRMLEMFGYRVVVAADGAEGVEAFRQYADHVSLVLTDMMMPVMNGAATVRALRTVRPGVRVVAVSGLGDAVDIPEVETDAHRPVRRLAKPYSTEELLEVLHAALQDGA